MAGIWAYGADIDYGLRFKSNTISTTTESSLLLYDGKALRTRGKDFSIEFEMRNPNSMQFGSLLRIAPQGCDPIDLIYYVNNRSQFVLGATYKETVVEFLSSVPCIGKWSHLKVIVSPSAEKIEISFGDEVQSISNPDIRQMDKFRSIFGSGGQFGAGPEEVADVDIRNVKVKKDDQLVYYWKLMAHGDNFCLDEVKGAKAVEASCEWLVDRYTHWEKEMSITRASYLGSDMGDGKLWLWMRDRVESYDCASEKIDTFEVKGGHPASYAEQQFKYIDGKIVSYNLESGLISSFDTQTRTWSGKEPFTKDYCHYFNSACVDTVNHHIVSFGGYGLYIFSDEFSVLDYKSGELRQTNLPEVSYRYRPSSAVVDGKMYIHGGYGTFNGHQGFALIYYNDLYAVDTKTFEVAKIWQGEAMTEDALPAENMIWDKDEQCFYVIHDKTGLIVEKMTLQEPGSKKLSNPYQKDPSQKSPYPNNLFRCLKTGKLYCVAQIKNEDSSTNITLLSMLWPPTDAKLLTQKEPKEKTYIIIVVSVCLICGLTITGCVVYRRRRKNKSGLFGDSLDIDNDALKYDFSKSSISFLGGFGVIDKDGQDITRSFTPILKSILVLTILSAPKGGIATSRFDRIIWPYKPEDTTNNNRNVYLSRIRPLLERIGGIRIISKNKILHIEIEKNVFCDYLETMRLLGAERNNKNVKRLTNLLLRGSLLPNMENSWIEPYRKDLSSQVVEILGYQLRRTDLPAETKLSIADLILNYDYLNEDALRCKCKVLTSQGKTGLAKEVYDKFCSEYQEVMGIEYHLPFNRTI